MDCYMMEEHLRDRTYREKVQIEEFEDGVFFCLQAYGLTPCHLDSDNVLVD